MSLRNFFLKSKLTYKIYLYYNLLIRHKALVKRKYYSQWGEDVEIFKYFKNKKKGNYLDIGCFHPIMYSNTYLLYQKGWRGINIDLNQTSIDLFNIMRPNDINLCRAIGSTKKFVKVFFDNHFSPVNTIDSEFYKKHKKTFFKNKFKRLVKVESIKNIINKNKNNKFFDFINIDAEGMDFKILSKINLKSLKTSMVAIETHHFDGKKTKDYVKIINFLKKYKFKLIKKFGPTSLFVKNY